MKIRAKVIALVACLCVVLVAAQLLVEESVLMPSFAELEREDATTAMRRIAYAFDLTLERVAVSARDWGNWADIYRFMQDHDRSHVIENITPASLKGINIEIAMIVDNDARIVYDNFTAVESGRPVSRALADGGRLPASFPWRQHLGELRPLKGLVATERGVLMLGGAPILDGNGHGPARGTLLLGRFLTEAEVQEIGSRAQSRLALLPAAAPNTAPRLLETSSVTQVYQGFDDIYGRPVMTLRVDVPRQISLYGRSALRYASAYLVLAAVILLVVLLLLLNKVVLGPLTQVTHHAVAIGKHADLTARLELNKQDEFGVLAQEFNRMVERLAESRRQLVDQSFEAGFGELARGVLHNLGNAMTPIGVRLMRMRERLRDAPVDEIRMALAELEAGGTERERAAQLEQFVRLAARELGETVRSTAEDTAVMERQAKAVQDMLAQQRSAARNTQLVEPVRVTELITETLDIVPDAARQLLRLEIEPTARELPVVNVARTVLRLVLQNLIINAADAVRAAGKERGTLSIGAAVQEDLGWPALYLQCRDDGLGIEAETLERLFEKGFSTKSRETNCGIGLHWCANALNALGGRIWATSDGRGRGATLHVLAPLQAAMHSQAMAGAA